MDDFEIRFLLTCFMAFLATLTWIVIGSKGPKVCNHHMEDLEAVPPIPGCVKKCPDCDYTPAFHKRKTG